MQSVLTALRSRDAIKDRKPLVLLGLLGPLLFLTVLGLFGLSVWRKSFVESDGLLRTWAQESSQFAAKFVSEAVARRIDNYYRLVQREANESEIHEEIASAQKELAELLRQLADDQLVGDEHASVRQTFVDHPARQALAKRMDELLSLIHI